MTMHPHTLPLWGIAAITALAATSCGQTAPVRAAAAPSTTTITTAPLTLTPTAAPKPAAHPRTPDKPLPVLPRPATPPAAKRTPVPQPAKTPNRAVYYANCAAARAVGAAPVYRGQPGYRAALDRDNDGVGCE